jgi:hypothetical protein
LLVQYQGAKSHYSYCHRKDKQQQLLTTSLSHDLADGLLLHHTSTQTRFLQPFFNLQIRTFFRFF